MSMRVVWAELVRRYELGEFEVRIQDLRLVHPYAVTRVTKMVHIGDLVRTRPGYVRIVEARLPPRLRFPEVAV